MGERYFQAQKIRVLRSTGTHIQKGAEAPNALLIRCGVIIS
ncbi:MAG: hypothetical protein ACP5TI_05705 [Thermoprotei archaeon]